MFYFRQVEITTIFVLKLFILCEISIMAAHGDSDQSLKFILNFQLKDYKAAEEEAKRKHLCIWQYGDITEDDAREFGMGR